VGSGPYVKSLFAPIEESDADYHASLPIVREKVVLSFFIATALQGKG
jgi:hypothetical protein